MLELDNVSAVRGATTIWSDGTFAVPSGSITGVIGPNGSGKTTLLLMILGLLRPGSGKITVFGQVPKRGNTRIGYVPQNYASIAGESIRARDLVLLGLTGATYGLRRTSREQHARVDQVLAEVGAGGFGDRRMSQLSGGQQQRVAIAQALVGNPRMLLLDEPLANLDVRNQQEIVDLLSRINTERGIDILLVVHDLNPLLSVLDGAIYLLDGHAHHDNVNEVVSEELLTHLYGTAIKVVRTPQGDLFTRSA
ncbi:MAG: ATP-binding cassette domain-containing protein [Candidatus Nanopelagicales bacterium]|nr:ATP-binding cassette domain-containing protein [Candidatus Nanopelagicales bacterium]